MHPTQARELMEAIDDAQDDLEKQYQEHCVSSNQQGPEMAQAGWACTRVALRTPGPLNRLHRALDR